MLVLLQPNSRDHLPIKRQTDRSHLISALSQQTITIDGRAFFFPKGKGMFSSMVILTLQRKVLVRRFHPPPSVISVFFLQLVAVGEETARNFNDTSGFGSRSRLTRCTLVSPAGNGAQVRPLGPRQSAPGTSACLRFAPAGCSLAAHPRTPAVSTGPGSQGGLSFPRGGLQAPSSEKATGSSQLRPGASEWNQLW